MLVGHLRRRGEGGARCARRLGVELLDALARCRAGRVEVVLSAVVLLSRDEQNGSNGVHGHLAVGEENRVVLEQGHVVSGTRCPFRQLVQNALDVGWVAIIGDRFTIDVERCWWVLAVCGIGSGFVAEAHLRGGLWSGLHRYHVEMRALFVGRWVC